MFKKNKNQFLFPHFSTLIYYNYVINFLGTSYNVTVKKHIYSSIS